VKYLLDTHLLIWAVVKSRRVPPAARGLIENPQSELYFSVVNLWEISVKKGLGRKDFTLEPGVLRRELLDAGYIELSITGFHVLALDGLPPIHKDLFDRMLVAQAISEGLMLLTSDATVAKYPGPVRLV
jgi:PIN domain nuclease of toxin-antitoxin system